MSPLIYKHIGRVIVFTIIFMGVETSSFSCSTPVFRYALEMWPAYAYNIEIIHNGDLDNSQQQAIDILKKAASSDISANLKIVETRTTNNSEVAIIKLTYPDEQRISGTIWQGPLTKENAEKIINSPSRKKALHNIQRGDAVVWLFLESGNTLRDDKQYALLKEELIRLSKTLKLSETATDVAGNLLDIKVINTGVNFSLVRIDRNNPMEEIFINILLGTEVDLKFFENAPLAFPMFGQGRVLYALAGNGIKSKNIETACSTIIGWCSCIIKDDNPGTDLLFTADWDGIIGDSSWIIPEQIPEITGLSGFVSDDAEVDDLIETENEIPENITPPLELTVEERLVVEVAEPDKQVEKTQELTLEPAKVNNEILQSPVKEDNQNPKINPLIRNSLITIALILVIVSVTLFIMKRK